MSEEEEKDPCIYIYEAFQPNLSVIKEKVALITVNRCEQQRDQARERRKRKKSKKKKNTLCARGKRAAKAKYDVYPSAYANGYAVQVCKGKIAGLDGNKKCSGSYCRGKKNES